MAQMAELVESLLNCGPDDLDVDEFAQLCQTIDRDATAADLPLLLAAMRSDRADWLVREVLSSSACVFAGPKHLEELLVFIDLGFSEGHDHDGFQSELAGLVERIPEEARDVMQRMKDQGSSVSEETIDWLLEYTEPVNQADVDAILAQASREPPGRHGWLQRLLRRVRRVRRVR